jgi:hypothetical protein
VKGVRGVRTYPLGREKTYLGEPKKTWSSSKPHLRNTREAQILAHTRGYAYPLYPLEARSLGRATPSVTTEK